MSLSLTASTDKACDGFSALSRPICDQLNNLSMEQVDATSPESDSLPDQSQSLEYSYTFMNPSWSLPVDSKVSTDGSQQNISHSIEKENPSNFESIIMASTLSRDKPKKKKISIQETMRSIMPSKTSEDKCSGISERSSKVDEVLSSLKAEEFQSIDEVKSVMSSKSTKAREKASHHKSLNSNGGNRLNDTYNSKSLHDTKDILSNSSQNAWMDLLHDEKRQKERVKQVYDQKRQVAERIEKESKE